MDVSMADVNNWGWQGSARTIEDRTTYLLDHSPIPFNITFKVGMTGEEPTDIQAHKDVLAIGSEVFYSMFYGLVATEEKIINVADVSADAFRTMIRYLYTDKLHEEHLDVSVAFETMRCAGKYGVPYLYNLCRNWIIDHISMHFKDNEKVTASALLYLQTAVRKEYEDGKILEVLWYEIDARTPAVLKTPDDVLGKTSQELMIELLSRDSLSSTKEKHLWANLQSDGSGTVSLKDRLGNVDKAVRYALMEPREIADGPAADGVLTAEDGIAIYTYHFASVKPAVTFNTTPRKATAAPTIITNPCSVNAENRLPRQVFAPTAQMARLVPAVVLRFLDRLGSAIHDGCDVCGKNTNWGFVLYGDVTFHVLDISTCDHDTVACDFTVTKEQRDALAGQAEKSVRLGPGDVAIQVQIDDYENRVHVDELTFIFGGPSYRSFRNDNLEYPNTTRTYLFYLGRLMGESNPSFTGLWNFLRSVGVLPVHATISLNAKY